MSARAACPPDPAAGLRKVDEAIAAAAKKARRDPRSITMVAASKTVGEPTLRAAIAAGQRVYGENRVQEASAKWPRMRAEHPDIELHLIGPLQSNKAAEAVALFDVIQSLDRPSLCRALANQCARQDRRPRLFVQVNTGAEAQKSGVAPEAADEFLRSCLRTYELEVSGLMCVPPVGERAEPHFRLLGEIATRNGVGSLSMGMSADYPLAVAHGATHVRVGSAIFGARG